MPNRVTIGAALLGTLAAAGVPARPAGAAGSTEKVIYAFRKGLTASIPTNQLAVLGGKIYGTTFRRDGGTAYSVTTGGVATTLHVFEKGHGAPSKPDGGLINVHGVLYGTTLEGGQYNYGTFFSMSPAGVVTTLHSFGAAGDGNGPVDTLLYQNGLFYGTASGGGPFGGGIVFSMTPGGSETILHAFDSTAGDGIAPFAGLVSLNGVFYGTTMGGGVFGFGTVFSVTPSGQEAVLHSFGASGDGIAPYAPLTVANGVLYGTTCQGGAGVGALFGITTSGQETVLSPLGFGACSITGLTLVGGTLYGVTVAGGTSLYGTVFRASLAGDVRTIYSFRGGSDGTGPESPLLKMGTLLYGTTIAGGADDLGVVYSITP